MDESKTTPEIQNSIVEKTSFEICVTVFCIASYRKPNSSCSKHTAGEFTGLATRNLALGKPSCRKAYSAGSTPRPHFVLSVPLASLCLGLELSRRLHSGHWAPSQSLHLPQQNDFNTSAVLSHITQFTRTSLSPCLLWKEEKTFFSQKTFVSIPSHLKAFRWLLDFP